MLDYRLTVAAFRSGAHRASIRRLLRICLVVNERGISGLKLDDLVEEFEPMLEIWKMGLQYSLEGEKVASEA